MAKINIRGYKCERCGHRWVPRANGQKPKVCPKCKSPYWNTPRKNNSAVVRKNQDEDRKLASNG